MRPLTPHAPPYLRSEKRTPNIMLIVCLSLIPPITSAVWFFGFSAVRLLAVAVAVSFLTDRLSCFLHRTRHPFDASAIVSGLILALSCPRGTPLWLIACLCILTIAVFRDAFGGIGANIFNPAMASRAVLLTVFPAYLSGYTPTDAVSSATPLSGQTADIWSLIYGNIGGSMGETSVLMIVLGAAILLYCRIIRWQIPVFSIGTFLLVILLGGGNMWHHLLSGGFLFGAVYIFTDYTSSPVTTTGEILFAIGVGAITAILRLFSPYPEGVCFAVLVMNLLTPLLDHYTHPRVYGTKRKEHAS